MESEKKESEVHQEHHSLHHNEKKSFTEKARNNPWIISTFVLGIIVLILVLGNFLGVGFLGTGNVVSPQSAGTKAVDFLNNYIVPGGGITLSSIQDSSLGYYIVNVTSNGKQIPISISKDGQYLDLAGGMVNINSYEKLKSSSTGTNTQQATNVPKADKPTVELYVFTYCPYGLQMEKAILPVVKLLGDKINFRIRQIGAMHGDFEKVEAQRQLCIEKNYPTKYLDYVLAFAEDTSCPTGDSACVATKTNSLFTKFGMDANTINSCMTSEGKTLYDAEVANANSKGASGSPTIFINGVVAQVDRSPAGSLTAVCSAFNTAPTECSQKLSTSQAAAGFGTGSSSSTASPSCATA